MRNLKNKVLIIAASLMMLFNIYPSLAYAACPGTTTKEQIQCGANDAAGKKGGNPEADVNATIKTIINLLSVIVGIVAVVMLIIGGFRYITSGGAAEKVTSAKNTIIYALIGLVIVALAQVIVRFVLSNVTGSNKKTSYSQSLRGARLP